MLTFKQSVLLLVSIITILAIIALGTGLSPLYWPMPKDLTRENYSSVALPAKTSFISTVKTSVVTRLKPMPKIYNQLTTNQLVTINSSKPTTQLNAIINDTSISNISNL